jgi:uncharacterized protein YecT (DUF1311 family)
LTTQPPEARAVAHSFQPDNQISLPGESPMKKFLRAAVCACALVLSWATTVCAAQQQQRPAAQAAQAEEQEDPCPGSQTQAELNQCASQAFQKADAELNKLYRQLMKDAGTGEKAKLRAAQLAWLKFRDAHCEYEAFGNTGGSIYPMVYGFCLEEVTRERVKQFRDTLKEIEER